MKTWFSSISFDASGGVHHFWVLTVVKPGLPSVIIYHKLRKAMYRKFLLLLLSLCLVSPVSAWGIIRECSSIEEVASETGPETLIVFDIDNTLLHLCQMLGSDEWFYHYLEQQRARGCNDGESKERAEALLHCIYALTKVAPMEERTAEFVRSLQNKKNCIIGLTSRRCAVAHLTAQHLASCGIDLSLTAPRLNSSYCSSDPHPMYTFGILFSDGKAKKNVLAAFLKDLSWKPKKIVCIDDKRQHLEELSALEDKENVFVGLRFSGGDACRANFRPEVSDIEHNAFAHIMSDAIAQSMIDAKSR